MSDDPADVWPLIWKELYARYKELVEVNERFGTQVRCVVVGAADSRPDVIFARLFGEPAATAEQHTADGTVWRVVATFALDDVPGLGQVGGNGPDELALAYVRESDLVLLTTLWERRPTLTEQGLYSHVRRLGRVGAVLVLPAADGAQPPEAETDGWRTWETELGRVLDHSDVAAYPIRGEESRHLVALARAVHDRLDRKFRLSLIAKLRHGPSRDALVVKMIHELSRVAAFLGLNPIPFSDAVAITPVQVLLVCRIAAAFGVKVTVGWARDFLATCGAVTITGLGFRQLFREIVRRIADPALPVRMAVGGAVAWAGTQTVGHTARLYFAADGRLTVREAADQAKALVQNWADRDESSEEIDLDGPS